jgi:hypothetical protein
MTENGQQKITARDEIQNFLLTNEAGIISSFSAPALIKAAESLYTANGLQCPVKILNTNGSVLLINREVYLASQAP